MEAGNHAFHCKTILNIAITAIVEPTRGTKILIKMVSGDAPSI